MPSRVSDVSGGGSNWREDLVQPTRPLEDMQARKQAKLNKICESLSKKTYRNCPLGYKLVGFPDL